MVWVLPCNFDARHHHGSVNIRNTKVINIFNGSRRSSGCYGGYGFGFGGGFWSMLGSGIGMGLGMGIFNGLFGGNGLLGGLFGGGNGGWFGGGQIPAAGNYTGAGAAGAGCNCGCGTGINTAYTPYIPGQYSILGRTKSTKDPNETNKPDDTNNNGNIGGKDNVAGNEGNPATKVDDGNGVGTGKGEGVDDGNKDKNPAGITDGKYNLEDLLDENGNPKNPLSTEEAKEARENFWKSIGAKDGLSGLDKAWNNNRLQLAKDNAGNVYVIYKDEQGNKTAFKYDPETKQYTLPNGTTFNKFSENCTDEVAKPKNIDETKNKNVTQNWSAADAEVTTVAFDGRDKENGNCVKVGSTFGSWLLNHNNESIAQVTKNTDKIFEEYAHGDDKISFDEFIAYLSGYEADAMRATSDTAYGKNSKYHDTVDMDAYDMVKLTKIFNKYATNGNIDKAGFNTLISEMNQLKNSNVIVK